MQEIDITGLLWIGVVLVLAIVVLGELLVVLLELLVWLVSRRRTKESSKTAEPTPGPRRRHRDGQARRNKLAVLLLVGLAAFLGLVILLGMVILMLTGGASDHPRREE